MAPPVTACCCSPGAGAEAVADADAWGGADTGAWAGAGAGAGTWAGAWSGVGGDGWRTTGCLLAGVGPSMNCYNNI